MKYEGSNGEYFEVTDINQENSSLIALSRKSELSLVWFVSDDNVLKVDSVEWTFNHNDILFLTEFHKVEVSQINGLKLLRFNRPFYCILDHDSEIGCKGILYYGASDLSYIHPNEDDVEVFKAAWKVLCMEMKSTDNLQLEMLQMLLKRILILCTRIYKVQRSYQDITKVNVDIIREFNFLVEIHFRQKHNVADYADLVHKSPKTLSNVFKKMSDKTPLQFIHERLLLEARRLLRYTDKSISAIGYEIGFADVQAFSRFFKTQEGLSPLDFRKIQQSGTIANS